MELGNHHLGFQNLPIVVGSLLVVMVGNMLFRVNRMEDMLSFPMTLGRILVMCLKIINIGLMVVSLMMVNISVCILMPPILLYQKIMEFHGHDITIPSHRIRAKYVVRLMAR